jgi:ElaB/YqjD/DUF883 family membrane-anchored ribosome-binding protein
MIRNEAMGKGENTDSLKDKASKMADKLRETGSEIYDEAKDSFEHGRRTVRHWEETLEQYIQEKPVRSILIAAGVGWLIGAIWRRL